MGANQLNRREATDCPSASNRTRAHGFYLFIYSFFSFRCTKQAWEVYKNEPLVSSPAVYH